MKVYRLFLLATIVIEGIATSCYSASYNYAGYNMGQLKSDKNILEDDLKASLTIYDTV